ncbi:MAG: hypothetical protein IPF46_06785 [Saprospiraceae bacterium]|nr:hypothetical protein [Candidatus Vicinibacter affinis]
MTLRKYFDRLCERYEKNSQERKDDFRAELVAKQIDLEKLIKGNSDLIKNNAQQLSEALIEFWYEYVALSDKALVQEILGKDPSLENIREMYQKLFIKVSIAVEYRKNSAGTLMDKISLIYSYEIIADISLNCLINVSIRLVLNILTNQKLLIYIMLINIII